MTPPNVIGTAIGHDTARIDGRLKVTGGATFAAEFAPRGLVHAGLVRATVPTARIAHIDATEARAIPGVLAVITHEDAEQLEPLDASGMTGDWRLPLSDDLVHHAGQAIAVVVAETIEAVHEARAAVRVGYELLEPTLPVEATHEQLKRTAVVARGRESDSDHERGDLARVLSDPALLIIDETYSTAEQSHSPMEPHATIAQWSGGQLTVHDSTQSVHADRASLATAFGLDPSDVRVICPYVGGAFGNKGAIWPHTLITAMAARRVGRPVKLTLTRAETFTSVGGRPRTVQRVRLAARSDGTLEGLGHDSVNLTAVTTDWLESCTRTTGGRLYACENVRTTQRVARGHVNPPTFMRAPGETPGTFALESAIDELATSLELDPLQVRRLNHADRDPITGRPWSGKHLLECYERGAAAFGWVDRTAAPRSMREGDELVGWGVASCVFPGLRHPATAKVRISDDGRVRVRTGAHDLGTGAYTVCALVAADVLGVAVELVDVELGDSDLPRAPAAGGSATTASVGEAVAAASRAAASRLLDLAAADASSPLFGAEPDDVEMVDGRIVRRSDPSRSAAIGAILATAGQDCVEAQVDTRLETETSETWAIQTHGAHFCEVRIDPLNPRVRLSRVVSVMDVGRVINPRTARSQITGSIVMGMGMALGEHVVRDRRTGAPATASLADYRVPVHSDMPDIHVEFIDRPDQRIGSLGARGAGEVATTGLAAAVANAVFHATGRRVRDLPITPELLLD